MSDERRLKVLPPASCELSSCGLYPKSSLRAPINADRVIVQSNGYDGHEPMRTCPHCGKRYPLGDFGWRDMGGGKIRIQSWCRKCRSYKRGYKAEDEDGQSGSLG